MVLTYRKSSVDFSSAPTRPMRRQSVDVLTPGSDSAPMACPSPSVLNLKQSHKRFVSDCKTPSVKNFPSPVGLPQATDCTTDYLAKLIREKKQLECFPKYFENVENLLAREIARVRSALFAADFVTEGFNLPEPEGEVTLITEKIYVPVNEYPEFNFVGRILGPRGMTSKQLEQETGCKIMVRGRGSMKDKRKEEANRGRPNWEHLDEDLHVLIQCEDTENRCKVKLEAATKQIRRLLVPAPEGTDDLKRKQLMELAIMNGTYRVNSNGLKSPGVFPNHGSRFLYNSSCAHESPRTTTTLLSPRPRAQAKASNSKVFLHNNNVDYSTLSSILSPSLLESLSSFNDSMVPRQNTFDIPFEHFAFESFSHARSGSNGNNSNASFGL